MYHNREKSFKKGVFMKISDYNPDPSSVVLGTGIGLAAAYVINSEITEQAIRKINQAGKIVYNSLTFDNVLTFTVTCVGVSVASSFFMPAIRGIVREITR